MIAFRLMSGINEQDVPLKISIFLEQEFKIEYLSKGRFFIENLTYIYLFGFEDMAKLQEMLDRHFDSQGKLYVDYKKHYINYLTFEELKNDYDQWPKRRR